MKQLRRKLRKEIRTRETNPLRVASVVLYGVAVSIESLFLRGIIDRGRKSVIYFTIPRKLGISHIACINSYLKEFLLIYECKEATTSVTLNHMTQLNKQDLLY